MQVQPARGSAQPGAARCSQAAGRGFRAAAAPPGKGALLQRPGPLSASAGLQAGREAFDVILRRLPLPRSISVCAPARGKGQLRHRGRCPQLKVLWIVAPRTATCV